MRTIFEPEHEEFRQLVRSFFEKECAPHAARWEEQGHVDRDVWLRAGELGLLGWEAPEEFGGTGIRDFRYNAVMTEEFIATGSVGFGYSLHNDVMPPYLMDLTTTEQKRRWLPGWVSGERITALAMTEPGAGSDLKAIGTTAKPTDGGFLLNGSKTYITNGILSDLVIVVARTDPGHGHHGLSLLVVERGMEGFARGRNLEKVGMKAQDTAELFFNDVFVPHEQSHRRAGARLLLPDGGPCPRKARVRGHLDGGDGARTGIDHRIRPHPHGVRSTARRAAEHPVRPG